MNVKYERCCGIAEHKKRVVVWVTVPGADGQPVKETRTFETLTSDLEGLANWLKERGVTHVVMESTGVYWKPVFNLLDGHLEVLVVNAEHVKALSGRKTDVQDAEWLADLLRHGLLRGSFIPSQPLRELRDLTRYRTKLGDERKSEVNRLQKVLEDANIKLASVATDVKALPGRIRDHHRFMLAQHLSHIDFLDEAMARLDAQIEAQMCPFEASLQCWDSLPGINRRIAEILVAEVGADLKPFASADQLAAWAGMCPGNKQSGGKRFSGKTRKGSQWLRRALIEAAHGAAHTKAKYFQAQYRRLAARRGKQRAAVAVGHSLLVTGFHLITKQLAYQDLGANYFDERDRETVKRRAVQRLEKLGFQVQLRSVALSTA